MHRPIDVAFMFLKAELKQYDDTPVGGPYAGITLPPSQFPPQQQPTLDAGQTYLSNFDPNMGEPMGAVRVIPSRYFSDVVDEGVQPRRQSQHNLAFESGTEVFESKRQRKLEDKYGIGRAKKIVQGKDTGDDYYGQYRPFKRFDVGSGPDRRSGTWWTKPGVKNVGRAYTDVPYADDGYGREETTLIGLRGNIRDRNAQTRDAVESQEGFPEALLHDEIDPRDLVYMNPTEEDREIARRRSSNDSSDLMYNRYLMEQVARRYGLPSQVTDRMTVGRMDYLDPASNWSANGN